MPYGIAFDPSTGYIYVTSLGYCNVYVINGSTNYVVSTIAVGSEPFAIAYDSSNGYLYITNPCSNKICVINGTTNKIVTTVAIRNCPAWGTSNRYC